MKHFLVIIGLLFSEFIIAQNLQMTDFMNDIVKYDISELWTLNKFQADEDTIWVERNEPFGYIGDNYQRFYIHFTSVIQNPSNKLEYFVYGKTRVKGSICSFQGELIINKAQVYKTKGYCPNLTQGIVSGSYEFYEDGKQKGTGKLIGTFKTDFYIDEKGNIKYNALLFVGDGFENNQFEGKWISYKTNEIKKCNWGDYRIPDSKLLDTGTAEFMVDEKYVANGWSSFAQMFSSDNLKAKQAQKEEQTKWWIDIKILIILFQGIKLLSYILKYPRNRL